MFCGESMEDSPTTLYGLDGNAEILTPEMLMERGLKEDRFRIDRKKLEDMLQVQHQAGHGNEAIENAEDFFQKVMQQTATQVSWPSKLKIGAKSKKDPHVKIIGTPEDVQQAKDMILKVLDTKKNRVTLKMDVSHSDHSYIIGKGGFKIQQVMEETGCHIHFPDSNRNAIAEKSNQVSIAGEAEGVETARNKIRELLPLVFMFELPGAVLVKPGDESGPDLQHIQQTYSFNIAFRAIARGRILVVVRGCQRILTRLRQGLILLMKYLTGSETIPVMGFMQTEIAVQHHSFVMGINKSNLQLIMSKTGATIVFPGAAGTVSNGTILSNSGPLSLGPAGPQILQSKSSVLIQGSFDSVCLAWQDLLKCLPLVLMFDLKEGQEVDSLLVNKLVETYNVSIMVRPKMRENIKSVILRGAERDSKVLFQVRKEILGFEQLVYDGNLLDSAAAFAYVSHNEFEERHVATSTFGQNNFSADVASQNDLSMMESLSMLTNIVQQNPQLLGLLNTLSSGSNVAANVQQVPQYSRTESLQHCNHYSKEGIVPTTSSSRYVWGKYQNDSLGKDFGQRSFLPPLFPPSSNSSVSGDDADSGVYDSARSGKTNFSLSQPESSASSTTSSIYEYDSEDVSKTFSRSLSQGQEPPTSNLSTIRSDYDNKKILATKMVQQDINENARTPTDVWSGYGFSKSTPGFVLQKKILRQNAVKEEEVSNYSCCTQQSVVDGSVQASASDLVNKLNKSPVEQVTSPFIQSNFWDSMSQHQHQSSNLGYRSISNLRQLLAVLDLEQFNDSFAHHEIDLMTFLTLTDIDLQQLNINYAARKRMLAAIATMRDPPRDFSPRQFKAAPGAERKPLFLRNSNMDNKL